MDRNPTSHGSVYGHYLIFVFPFTICNLRRATFLQNEKKKSTEAYFMVDENYPNSHFSFTGIQPYVFVHILCTVVV